MAKGSYNNIYRDSAPESMFPLDGEMSDYPEGMDPTGLGKDVTVDMSGEDQPDDNFQIAEEPDGGATITFGDEASTDLSSLGFGDNLAESMEESVLKKISSELLDLIKQDDDSREEWKNTFEKGLGLLGLTYDERSEPFEGSTGVTHPLLNEAITQLQAQAYKEMLPAGGPVRTQIVGVSTSEKEAQAERVRSFMNYQITEVMEEYDPDYDQMLFYLGYGGSTFKKVYYDGVLGRGVSLFIQAKDLIVPYSARDLRTAERVTHVLQMSENELLKQQASGFYKDVDLTEPAEAADDIIQDRQDKITGVERNGDPETYVIYECHCNLDIKGLEKDKKDKEKQNVKLPFIVTLDSDTGEILAIRRNYQEDDPSYRKRQYFVHYKLLPGLGFYGFGLVHLLGNLSRSSTSILRQLIDSGTLANLPAGFKSKGLRIQDQDSPLQPGEWRDVDAPGGDLAANLIPLPYKEPSSTLMQLLGFCVGAAEKFIGTTDLGMSDGNQEMPVGTTIALLERGSRVMSAVHKRMHYAQKQELQLLSQVFADYLPEEYPYDVIGGERTIKAKDFDGRVDIIPVSDPNIFSMTQRITLAQEQLRLAQAAPDQHNLYEAYRRMYAALDVKEIDAILPPPQPPKPETAPVENGRSLQMPQGVKALKVFPDQDHASHIMAHMAFIQTPIVQTSPPVYGILIGHVMEHITALATQQVEQQMQQAQRMGQQVPPQIAMQKISQMEAQLVQQVLAPLTKDSNKDDPLVELKTRELDIRQQDSQRRAQEVQQQISAEQQRNADKTRMDIQRIHSNEDIAQMRVEAQLQKAGLR